MYYNNPRFIILHCSGSKDRILEDFLAIRRFHIMPVSQGGRGWRDIGYHFVVDLVGDEYVVFTGRMVTDTGAHCKGFNDKSIGICMVGGDPWKGFDDSVYPLSKKQLEATTDLMAKLSIQFNIPVDRIDPHRKYVKGKPCPGYGVDMDKVRTLVDVKTRGLSHLPTKTDEMTLELTKNKPLYKPNPNKYNVVERVKNWFE